MSEIDYDKILIYLDGFIVFDETPENQSDYPADPTFNKIVTTDEINNFYNIALLHTRSYLGLNTSSEINSEILPFIYMWSAGLIYKKYDIRPNDLVDETYPVGYGDQLIITAKAGLKPFKEYTLDVW